MRSGDSTPTTASSPAPSRRLLGAVLAACLTWIGACASAPPPQVPVGIDLPSLSDGAAVLEADQAKESPVVTEQDRAQDEAKAVLSASRAVSDSLLVAGRIAEDGRHWELAMASYEALPADHPQRASVLLRAKLQWRNSNLSMCAQQVFVSPLVTRAELAILLVSLAPQLESVGIGRSPVLSDIVDLPCRREVLTAVRCHLLAVDRLEHRFFPSQAARPEEVRSAVEGLCHILGIKPPVWCHGEEVTPGCALISMPVRGEQVAELVSRLTATEEP